MLDRKSFFGAILALFLGATKQKAKQSPTTGEYSLPKFEILWRGETFDNGETASMIIRAMPVFTETEQAEHLRFCNGYQWDEAVEKHRESQGRPTLTINKLNGLVGRILATSRLAGEVVSADDERLLSIAVAHRCKSAQQVYNYVFSAMVEEYSFAQKYARYRVTSTA